MKKSIFALSAAAMLAGFAGSAHAVYYFGDGETGHVPTGMVAATELSYSGAGVGNMLFVPYVTTQDSNATMINITNTDSKNGKAVKVRFRGAGNSDDVLDFTLLLSPGDVWTASISADAQDGRSLLKTTDKSCTLPAIPDTGVYFVTDNLPEYLSDAAKAAHTREAYMEVLAMADIPATTKNGKANALYTAIKHKNGVPNNCGATAVDQLINTETPTDSTVASDTYGLEASSGGLMGSWAIFDINNVAVFSDTMPAIQAQDANGNQGFSKIIFSPQSAEPAASAAIVNANTNDPVLIKRQAALWYDLPDMSTPLLSVAAYSTPVLQLKKLETFFGKHRVINEFTADASSSVQMATDWVVSQPTRRYYAAMEYGASQSADRLLLANLSLTGSNIGGGIKNPSGAMGSSDTYGTGTVTVPSGVADNPYYGLVLKNQGQMGTFACHSVKIGVTDREESTIASGAVFSPGKAGTVCGEVFVVSFGAASPLHSALTNLRAPSTNFKEGWGYAHFHDTAKLPLVGFAGTALKDGDKNYGVTLNHRW